MDENKIRKYSIWISVLFLIVGVAYLTIANNVVGLLIAGDYDTLTEVFQGSALSVAVIIALVLVIIEVVIGIIPGVFLYIIIGGVIGPFTGGVIILLGNVIGGIISYQIGYSARKVISKNGKTSRFETYLQEKGALGLFFLRANPLTSYDVLVHIAGALRMPFIKTIVANTIGLIPYIFISTYFGGSVPTDIVALEYMILFALIVYVIYSLVAFYKKRNGGVRR